MKDATHCCLWGQCLWGQHAVLTAQGVKDKRCVYIYALPKKGTTCTLWQVDDHHAPEQTNTRRQPMASGMYDTLLLVFACNERHNKPHCLPVTDRHGKYDCRHS